MSHPNHKVKKARHPLRRMTGRDLQESHRAATSLELLFDLTFVTCFALAASQFAHGVAAGHFVIVLLPLLHWHRRAGSFRRLFPYLVS